MQRVYKNRSSCPQAAETTNNFSAYKPTKNLFFLKALVSTRSDENKINKFKFKA